MRLQIDSYKMKWKNIVIASAYSAICGDNWFNETKAQLSVWERYPVKMLKVGSRSWEDSRLMIIYLKQFEIGKRWINTWPDYDWANKSELNS